MLELGEEAVSTNDCLLPSLPDVLTSQSLLTSPMHPGHHLLLLPASFQPVKQQQHLD